MVLTAGDGASAEHLVLIRADHNQTRRAVLLVADGTWNAYNDWGGSNHYEGIIDGVSNRFSPELSVQRPFARGMVSLPAGAPRTLPTQPPGEGVPLYPHMEWAWEQGYSKKYASAGWAMYERPFVHWAEEQGYALEFLSQRDLHRDPSVLKDVPCVICVGHDEYWSRPMRQAIDAYVDQGGNVARFAGNFMWQIRISDTGDRQICHKYRARAEDPLFGSDHSHLTTSSWEAPEIGYPGRATFGLDATSGLYAGFGGLAPRGAGGFTIYREDHWAFADANLGYGDILGAQSKIFGYEVDGLQYRIEDGLPHPVPAEFLPESLEILGLGLARLREDAAGDGETLFVGDEDAKFVAELRHGNTNEVTLARVNRGSGMIVCFSRGKGAVFHAGTTEWIAGLLRGDKAVAQVTRNVLNRFNVC
nr:N,N-dimethylformamidase beta subunit family domain-containing protein [Pseudophaeobacter sp. EL27]